jgi:hypothetical protein
LCCTFVSVLFQFRWISPISTIVTLHFISRWFLQRYNNVRVAAACHLVACILRNPKLTELTLDHKPSDCVGHTAWQGEGLLLPPSDVMAEGWTAVLDFLRVRVVCARSRNVPRARRVLRHRTPLQLPSPPSQRGFFRRFFMSCALCAASALVAPGRCRVPARVLQHHALLGVMLSQRSLARVALQDKRFLGSERLQLLCCGSPLSALLIRLAAVGRSSAEHRYIVCTVKRYFSGVAHRLWPKRRWRRAICLSFIEYFIYFLLRDTRIPFLVYDKLTFSSMHITSTTREFDFVLQLHE